MIDAQGCAFVNLFLAKGKMYAFVYYLQHR